MGIPFPLPQEQGKGKGGGDAEGQEGIDPPTGHGEAPGLGP